MVTEQQTAQKLFGTVCLGARPPSLPSSAPLRPPMSVDGVTTPMPEKNGRGPQSDAADDDSGDGPVPMVGTAGRAWPPHADGSSGVSFLAAVGAMQSTYHKYVAPSWLGWRAVGMWRRGV